VDCRVHFAFNDSEPADFSADDLDQRPMGPGEPNAGALQRDPARAPVHSHRSALEERGGGGLPGHVFWAMENAPRWPSPVFCQAFGRRKKWQRPLRKVTQASETDLRRRRS
jgi:hypothetical protein